ncbi:MAG TPA: hypothetical protein PLK90_10715 [Clostridiales bacterium]|nr:hypothetical protein [Clostridiales bacterium]HQP70861.1 hypothetical protein [Clostridiales bacterium]
MIIHIRGYEKNCMMFLSENKEKSTAVSEATNRFCGIIFNKIHHSGGSVYKFSGGNVTAFFPKEVHSRAVNNCGMEILSELSAMIKKGTKDPLLAKTSAGIGISYGKTMIGMFGSAVKEYFITGSTVEKAGSCVNEASRNEQVVCCSMRSRLGMCGFRVKNEGYFVSEPLEELFELQKFEKPSYSKLRTETFGGKIIVDFEKDNKTGRAFTKLSCLKIKSVVEFSEIKQDYKKVNICISEIIRITQSFGGYISGINVKSASAEITVLFGITGSDRNCAESAAGAALALQQAADVFSDTGMCITTGSGFCYAAGADGKFFIIAAGDFIIRNERLARTVSSGEIVIDNNSISEIPDASYENERFQGFRGLREKVQIFTLKPFSDKHTENCDQKTYLEKEEEDYENICAGNGIKKVFLRSDNLSSDYIAGRLYAVSTKYGKTHIICCKEESFGFPYYTIKILINTLLDEISSDRFQALKNLLEDLNESSNAEIFFHFLNDTYESRTKNDNIKYLFEDISISILKYYTERSKIFIFFSGAEFIDKESSTLIERFFKSPESSLSRIKGCISFIYSKDSELLSGIKSSDDHQINIESSASSENEADNNLNELDENSRTVLSYFCAEGFTTDAQIIKKAADDEFIKNGIVFEKCLKQLISKCILVRAQNRTDDYVFISSTVREKAYGTIPDGQKKKIHKALGYVYEKDYLKGKFNILPKLMCHYSLSDDKIKSREYLLKACIAGFNNFSPETARKIITDAEKLNLKDDSDPEATLVKAYIDYFVDNTDESLKICSIITSSSSPGSEIYGKALYLKLKIQFENNMFNETANEISVSAGDMQKNDIFIKIRCLIGLALLKIGKTDDANTLISSVYEIKNSIKDCSALVIVYELAGTLNLNTGKYKLARAYFEDMYAVAQDSFLPIEKLSALKLISESYEKENDSRKALETLDKICTESIRLHNFDHAVYCIERFRYNSKGYGNPKKTDFFTKRWLDAAVNLKRSAETEKIGNYFKIDSNQYF